MYAQVGHQGEERFQVLGPLSPPYLYIPRFPNFPLDGAGRTGSTSHPLPLILKRKALDLDLSKRRSQNSPREHFMFSCPDSSGLWPQSLGLHGRGISLETSAQVPPCASPCLSIQGCSVLRNALAPPAFNLAWLLQIRPED